MSAWILKNGSQSNDCASFPYAFRSAHNLVRKAIDAKQDAAAVIKGISIIGPPNPKGERTTYSYAQAVQLANDQQLLSPDGQINSREFKKR